jgi:hypothetical protein
LIKVVGKKDYHGSDTGQFQQKALRIQHYISETGFFSTNERTQNMPEFGEGPEPT